MSFKLLWLAAAEEQVVSAHLRAKEHGVAATFTQVLYPVETRMRISPLTIGESRGLRSYIANSHPLAVRYEVHQEENVVVVTGLHYTDH